MIIHLLILNLKYINKKWYFLRRKLKKVDFYLLDKNRVPSMFLSVMIVQSKSGTRCQMVGLNL